MGESVRRRRVHYFGGFDPRGAAYYHRLFRGEAAKPQPQGGVIAVGRREKLTRDFSRWQVTWRADAGAEQAVQTEQVFMGWDDVIRANWERGAWAMARAFVRTYWGVVRDVRLLRTRKLYSTTFYTGAFPAAYLLGTALLCLLAGWLLGWGARAWLGAGSAAWGLLPALPAIALLWRRGERLQVFWLLRTFDFIIRFGRQPVAGLAERQRAWVDEIISRQQSDPVDEVLLVGHSVGVLVMAGAVDMLLQDARWQALQAGRKTCMVTLGQCYPTVALVPHAADYREMLSRLCQHPALLWWDVSSRIDPLCFYRTHPLAGSGVPHDKALMPVMHDARFFPMYEPERWAQIRPDKLAVHFLYFVTPDKRGNFHLYDVLYGPRSLQEQMQQAQR